MSVRILLPLISIVSHLAALSDQTLFPVNDLKPLIQGIQCLLHSSHLTNQVTSLHLNLLNGGLKREREGREREGGGRGEREGGV